VDLLQQAMVPNRVESLAYVQEYSHYHISSNEACSHFSFQSGYSIKGCVTSAESTLMWIQVCRAIKIEVEASIYHLFH
jgi:hypothetical protein